MSNVNIKRLVENIPIHATTPYTPVVEIVVNAIQAIEEAGEDLGEVLVRVLRSNQQDLDGGLPDVSGFEIEDNGVGFDDSHRTAFDTLYTEHRVEEGGKGFGRFTCLKYFDDVRVESTYRDAEGWKTRTFSMGKVADIVVDEEVVTSDRQRSGTIVTLSGLRRERAFDKTLTTIGRNLAEKLLPFFITDGYTCPRVLLSESDGNDTICLNDFVNNELARSIIEVLISGNRFLLQEGSAKEPFAVRIFKLYAPGNHRSRISLVAHKREVSGSFLHKYVPEFEDEFYDRNSDGESDKDRNYIIKAYVFSEYLDSNVSLERGGFQFQMDPSLDFPIGQSDIERRTATIAQQAVGDDILRRQLKKRERVKSYVDEEAPWHKSILPLTDLSSLPYNPSNEEIEAKLQKVRFAREARAKKEAARLIAETKMDSDHQDDVRNVVSQISDTGKSDLVHYVVLRKILLDLLEKNLQVDKTGSYSSEGAVHDIIFPRQGDTEITPLEEHNLWMVDERLTFADYVSSDIPLNGGHSERPDLIAYHRQMLFRGDNEASNPITIFEFKRPQRDDFANRSCKEDPIQQIVRYVNDVRDGKYKTPQGRQMLVASNTPFYGYVICDLNPKVEDMLAREKDFKPMPDRQGWFQWMSNINLYVEVLSWDKVLKDARMRSLVFFNKLGI